MQRTEALRIAAVFGTLGKARRDDPPNLLERPCSRAARDLRTRGDTKSYMVAPFVGPCVKIGTALDRGPGSIVWLLQSTCSPLMEGHGTRAGPLLASLHGVATAVV